MEALASPAHLDVEAISGIAGSISIACWLVVFSPQIIENFRRSSAEGLSIRFVVVWLSGDVFNVLGGVLQGVLPTMLILAVYYMLCDIVLLSQCFYYRGFTLRDDAGKPAAAGAQAQASETSPLLPDQALNGQHTNKQRARRFSVDGTHLSPAVPLHEERDTAVLKARSPVQRRSVVQVLLFNLTAVLVVCAAGILGWYLSQAKRRRRHHHNADEDPVPDEDSLQFNVVGQVFGYCCAVLYLSSRIPQLLLNYRRRSTEGISILFFLFACLGNITYVLSILAFDPTCRRPGHCEQGEAGAIYATYFGINLSWLIGSFGTFLLDLCVFAQFWIYRPRDGDRDAEQPAERPVGSASERPAETPASRPIERPAQRPAEAAQEEQSWRDL